MAENKTKLTEASVKDFLDAVPDAQKRQDSYEILQLMQKASRMEPRMWGTAIVGFGNVHYKYESGREGDMPLVGFSPRKQNLTFYLMGGFQGYEKLLEKLGKHSLGKGCLYIKRLSDVDQTVLRELIERTIQRLKKSKQFTG